jgi:hypothetical protein
MSAVEHVTDAEVVDFNDIQARQVLGKFDAALKAHAVTGVELMDLCYEVRESKPWKVDDEFRAELAAGRIARAVDRSLFEPWVQFRMNRLGLGNQFSQRYLAQLAAAGDARRQLACAIAQADLPSTEWSMRPLTKLFNPRPISGEQIDLDELRVAAAAVYIDALEHEGDPNKASKAIVKYIKRSNYAPLRRSVSKPQKAKDAEREAMIDKARQAVRDGFNLLLKEEQRGTYRDLLDWATEQFEATR